MSPINNGAELLSLYDVERKLKNKEMITLNSQEQTENVFSRNFEEDYEETMLCFIFRMKMKHNKVLMKIPIKTST